MKHPFLKLFAGLAGLYAVLHLVLASSFVQGRVLDEVRRILGQYGVELSIESIEFSAFSPKIYLNRVMFKTTEKAPIQLPTSLSIDKIKIEFQPLALISGQIIIQEAALHHPNIVLRDADQLYARIKKLAGDQKQWQVKGGGRYSVVFKKVAIVDAVLSLSVKEPNLAIDSGRFSIAMEQNARDQQTLTLSASHMKIDRGELHAQLKTVDLDLDLTPNSVRVNRVVAEGDDFYLNVKGASSLVLKPGKGPESFHSAYDLRIPLEMLNAIPELKDLKLPRMKGTLSAAGNIENARGSYLGLGKLRFHGVQLNEFGLGGGDFEFRVDEKQLTLSQILLRIGNGELSSSLVQMDLKEPYAVRGEFKLSALRLENLLASLKCPDVPIRLGLNGSLKISGSLAQPGTLEAQLKGKFNNLLVLSHNNLGVNSENIVIDIFEGDMESTLKIGENKASFQSSLGVLGGKLVADGMINFDNTGLIKFEGQNLSLTALRRIDDLELGGIAKIYGSLAIGEGDANISGGFEVEDAEIAGVVLGKVKGTTQYQDFLLSFESLELPALEMIRSTGYVDFRPKENYYRFQVGTRRASVDQIFDFFKKQELGFTKPIGGEVGARVLIEGGHDQEGIKITAVGNARGVSWYDEKWSNSSFTVVYRPAYIDISRAVLTKRSGALEVKGHFAGNKSSLKMQSVGLRLEDLDHVGKVPLFGELSGQVTLEGDLMHPNGSGEARITKMSFRGNPLGDSRLSIREKQGTTEFLATLFGDKLHARLTRSLKDSKQSSDLLLNFSDCDFAPLLSLWLLKDVPPVNAIRGTGDLALSGILDDWNSVRGSGSLSSLNLDLRNSQLKSERAITLSVEAGNVKVPRFELVGPDSQVAMDLAFKKKGPIKGALDAKLDLQYLQPFIPGLEYGTGKVTAGIRLSGNLPEFTLLGNVILDDGTFRISEVTEEFRSARAQLSLTQDKISVDRFEASHGGGNLRVSGDVGINRFTVLHPNLSLSARKVGFREKNYLTLQVSGDFSIKGENTPYVFGGKCELLEGHLNDFNIPSGTRYDSKPVLKFDIHCNGTEKLFVTTDVMDSEFKGDFRLVGDTQRMGLLGSAEGIKGSLLFKETRFAMSTATVKFEDGGQILPRFNVSGKAYVKEQGATVPIEYEVNLQVFGTPSDYKIRLSSNPTLTEPDIIALLVLGVTTRGQDDNYLDFGTTIVGKTPLQTKIQSELGVDIKVNMKRGGSLTTQSIPNSSTSTSGDPTVPAVKIEKDITKKTKLSYSNTLDSVSIKEFKIEQLLDDNFTVNATAVDKLKGNTENDTVKSYGVDFRYRFQFE